MEKKKSVAIITARGGSKRIPRKNIRPFLGRPILEYPIRAALASGVFDEVMVSTDDEEIAAIARAAGAVTPFPRSKKNSDDFSTTAEVLTEVLKEYQSRGTFFETYCGIYPTAPFVTAEKLRLAGKAMADQNAISVIPVVRFSYPIQRALQISEGLLSMMDVKYINSRSQDLTPAYHDCGQFYFGRTEILFKTGQIFSERTVPLVMPETEVQDIDHEEDWVIAELKFKLLKNSGQS